MSLPTNGNNVNGNVNGNGNNNKPPNNLPKKRRWYYSNENSKNKPKYENNATITHDLQNQNKPLLSKAEQLKKEQLENNEQVARMEKQLHDFFQKSNTPYTFIDDTGIYKFEKPNTKQNAKNTNTNTNTKNVSGNKENDPAKPLFGWTASFPTFSSTSTAPFSTVFNPQLLFPIFPPSNIPMTTNMELSQQHQPQKHSFTPKPDVNITVDASANVIEEVTIQEEINHIDDLISLCEKYPLSESRKYNINMKAIHAIKDPLQDLSNMIGMETLKRNIVDQIIYYIQNLHIKPESIKTDSDIAERTETKANSDPNATFLNPFAATFFPPSYSSSSSSSSSSGASSSAPSSSSSIDISERLDFGGKQFNNNAASSGSSSNPFGNLQPLFDFTAMNKKITDNIKKKYEDGISDFSAPTSGDFMHTVIYGPPGSGKTEVAKIIGRIFSGLGILSKKTFKKVSRHDLVAGYLGQTAIKTKDIIKSSLGGVLFIDEAYSLGNPEKRDSFAKECIDTLCEALSEHKSNWMVIIAGYEKELNECFFNSNEGLNSRFTWRFKLDGYKSHEMKDIFVKKIKEYNWTVANDEKIAEEWFESRMDYFTTYGRDMETLFTKTKIAHSRRVFCLPETVKTKITVKDLENGFKLFLDNPEVKERKERGTMGNYMKTLYV
jgi:hypothetical protein